MRPMNRHALADIHRTAQDVEAARAEAYKAALKAARYPRKPGKASAVLPAVLPGDVIVTWTGARVTVAKVNRVSITSTTGVRYGAGEIQYAMPGEAVRHD